MRHYATAGRSLWRLPQEFRVLLTLILQGISLDSDQGSAASEIRL